MSALVAAVCCGWALLLAVRPRARLQLPPGPAAPTGTARGGAGRGRARRLLVSAAAGAGGALFLGGPLAWPAGLACALAAWVVLSRSEPSAVRRERERVAADLPHLVRLVGAGLRSGLSVGDAVQIACGALPGPAADRLAGVPHRLGLGVDPVRVWTEVADDSSLAPLGRALARAQESGAPVVTTVDRLSTELEEAARSTVEDRARSVGVRAALPLGLCLLPSFLLLGIVPLVVGLLAGILP